MAKWRDDLAGNSCHIHLSLWDVAGTQGHSFAADEPHSMTPALRHFLGGLLRHAREFTYLLAPNVNSYKRFVAGTFAPTSCAWSRDNRTAGFRLVGEGTPAVRIECRVGGADLNPYLAYAGLVAAGLAGMQEGIEPPPPLVGDAYAVEDLPQLPATLREALECFSGSQLMRSALGDAVVDHYAHAGAWEQRCHDEQVSDWELRRGFEQA